MSEIPGTTPASPGAAAVDEITRARSGARMLARIVATDRHVMEAARIEMKQNGPHAAMQWILNSLPDVWDGPEGTAWDGSEPAQAWFDRTETAYHAAETPDGALGKTATEMLAESANQSLALLAEAHKALGEVAAERDKARTALGFALDALRQVTYLGTEEDAFYDIAAGALRALDDGTLTPSVLGRFMDRWPRCPDGCGCRLATDDADRAECGCDGPCTAECRENGYPDAPSYRDAAVKHVMDELDAARSVVAEMCAHFERIGTTREEDERIPGWRERAGLEAS